MDDFKQQLRETRQKIRMLAGQNDLSDSETELLAKLTGEAAKLEGRQAALEQTIKADEADQAQRAADIKAATDAVRMEEREKAQAAAGRLPFAGDAPYQAKFGGTWKYDGLETVDLSLMIGTLQGAGKPVSHQAIKAMALRVGEMKEGKDANYVKSAFKAETGIDPDAKSIEAAVKTEGDPMYSTGSNIGDKWVGTAYSTELWRAIRAASVVASKVPEIIVPDGYSSIYVPLESTDPTWYKVAEATAGDSSHTVPKATATSSKVGTLQKQVTLGKLGARVLYTGELVEDALISFVPQLREQLQVSGAEILEHVIIDGDTEDCTSVNINAIDTQPAEAPPYFITNGFRKLALVTNTANSRSAGGALVIEDYIDTLKLMGTAGLAGADMSKVSFIVDANVHYANMKLTEVKTRDVYAAATVENGFLARAYGIPLIPSWQMHLQSAKRMANTAGKIDADTDTNNTTGSILAVRWDQWRQAFKRRMTMETTRIANADAWEIVALIRWGLAFRDNEASAISYNVGV